VKRRRCRKKWSPLTLFLLLCIQSMQAKQKSLLERVDALDKECEELQRQLGDREERHIELDNELQQMSEEKEQLQSKLAHHQDLCLKLEKEKQRLEKNIGDLNNSVDELKQYLQTSKEKERLLVAFPELSPQAQAQPQSTGNVLLDMKQQLEANSIRIKVLEQENAILHNSIEKLGERTQYNAARVAGYMTHSNNPACVFTADDSYCPAAIGSVYRLKSNANSDRQRDVAI
uniref:Uncharacterized protein n=1 Tax=Echeneis naucrates TaxID=173247 RepID=A0A665X0P3_ECHNA